MHIKIKIKKKNKKIIKKNKKIKNNEDIFTVTKSIKRNLCD